MDDLGLLKCFSLNTNLFGNVATLFLFLSCFLVSHLGDRQTRVFVLVLRDDCNLFSGDVNHFAVNVNPGLINPVYGCLIGRVPFMYH